MNFATALQGVKHGPAKMAEACRIAAETARRDPFWSPEEGERRAQAYEAQAREWAQRAEAGA